MKEYPFPIDKHFRHGLRPFEKQPTNSPWLIEAFNVKITAEQGIVPVPTVSGVGVGVPAVTWPFPQAVQTAEGILVFDATSVLSVDNAGILTQQLTYPANTSQFSIADFMKYVIAVSGSTVLIKDENGDWSVYTPSLHASVVCNYRGQLLLGGYPAPYENIVSWGGIGSANVPLLMSTVFGLEATDLDTRKNTAGNRPLPWPGKIYAIKELGDVAIVYASNGIAALVSTGSVFGEVAPTFGFKELLNTGIAGRCAVAGDKKLQMFIDNSGYVWVITEKLELKRLGYQEFFNTKTVTNNWVVSHDPVWNDFYFANGDVCYLMASGLSQLSMLPTSLFRQNNELIGVVDLASDLEARVETEVFDMGMKSMKTITGCEVCHDGDCYLKAKMRYVLSTPHTVPFVEGPYKRIYKGLVTPMATGSEFKLSVRCADYTTFSLDDIVVRWSSVDKRILRGPYDTTGKMASDTSGG